MENLKDKIFKLLRLDNLMDNLSGYVETRLELYKLEIREDVAKVLSKALIYGFIAILGMLFLVFFSVGLAHFLNVFFAGALEPLRLGDRTARGGPCRAFHSKRPRSHH